jgi:hypothetical protein
MRRRLLVRGFCFGAAGGPGGRPSGFGFRFGTGSVEALPRPRPLR